VQQFADPDTVYNRPANLFVARFMGAPPMNTLPARLVEEDGRLFAAVGNGAIRVPIPDGSGTLAGRAVVLGIRPECITEPNRRLDDDAMLIDAAVEMTEPTGAETIVLLRLAGHTALARISPDVRLQAGAMARFALDTRKVCLFDPVTERLIE
jgi:multiple sugar transport system ATP-binding protein